MGPLGSALKERRLELGLTQAKACLIFGVTEATYSRWEGGRSIPDASHFDAIAKFLGYSGHDDGTFPLLIVRNEMWASRVEPNGDLLN